MTKGWKGHLTSQIRRWSYITMQFMGSTQTVKKKEQTISGHNLWFHSLSYEFKGRQLEDNHAKRQQAKIKIRLKKLSKQAAADHSSTKLPQSTSSKKQSLNTCQILNLFTALIWIRWPNQWAEVWSRFTMFLNTSTILSWFYSFLTNP